MAAFIGNFLLLIASFITYSLNVGALSRPAPGGDAAVGHAWGQLILNGAFILVMLLVTLLIGSKGGFEWVSANKSTRFWLVTISIVACITTTVVTTLFRHEAGPAPLFLKPISTFAPVLIPIVLILGGFVLLNSSIRESLPLAAYKWPLMLISILGLVGTLSFTFSMMAQSAKNKAAIQKDRKDFYDKNDQRILDEIDSNDVMTQFVFLLVFTGDNQPPHIQNKAVAKVKTHPQWQEELVRLLQTEWAPEPFQFLSSNDVDNPAIFLEPVRLGILQQTELIRTSIQNASHPSHFYKGQFMWEVERVIRTVDRFKGKGVDYMPAMKEFRKAFDQKSNYEKPKWICLEYLDKWLKENG